MSRLTSPRLTLALIATALPLALGACSLVEAKIYNLEQLHDSDSNHRYTAALEDDLEFFFRHKVLSLAQGVGANLTDKTPGRVEAPADECLGYLIALEDYDPGDPALGGQEVEWFARLAVEDPWRLSRERASQALGRRGELLGAGLPANLGADQKAAGADEVGAAVTDLVHAVRVQLESARGGSKAEVADLARACDAVRALELDLSGGRRALNVVTTLTARVGTRSPSYDALRKLNLDLQRLCVRRALGRAIEDPDPIVRAAALRSAAQCGGREAIDTVLFDKLARDPAPEPAIAILDVVAQHGLADPPKNAGDSGASAVGDTKRPDAHTAAHRSREEWLAAIYAQLSRRPEGDVRVHAMSALGQLTGAGFSSLREEDWQAWWNARHAAHDAAVPGSGAAH